MFGNTFSWDDGLSVSISAPAPFTPSEFAAADPANAYAAFTVTITNKTGKTFDPTTFYVTGMSGANEAGTVFDSDQNVGSAPNTGILDGRDATFQIGFGVADPADVVLEVSPGYDYLDAYFTSTGTLSTGGGTAPAPAGTVVKDSDSDRLKFGEVYEWKNGLMVSVAAGAPFTPSEYASTDAAAAYVSYTVTIANNTGTLYDPSLFFVSGQSGSTEAKQVYDSENGFNGTPGTGLMPGRTVTFLLGYGVADTADVVLEVTPGFDYSDAYFTA